jgi:hypothetical protein
MMVSRVEVSESGFSLGADVVAAVLRVGPDKVMAHIRDGTLTTRCEKGVDKDAGRHRLTFLLGKKQARLVIDDAGRILQSSCVDLDDLGRARVHVRREPTSLPLGSSAIAPAEDAGPP